MKTYRTSRLRYLLAGFLNAPKRRLNENIISQKSGEHPRAFLEACQHFGIRHLPVEYLNKYPIQIDTSGGSIAQDVLTHRNYQFFLLENFARLFDIEGHQFVNVGANIGTTCLNAYEVGFRTFHAFEPMADNFQLLESNLQSIDAELHLHQCGVGAKDETAEIFVNPHSTGRHSLVKDFGFGTNSIKTVKLDGFLPDEKSILWVDAEGAELSVLEGAETFISKNVNALCIEVTPGENDATQRLVDFLKRHFTVFYTGTGKKIESETLLDELTANRQTDLFAGNIQ